MVLSSNSSTRNSTISSIPLLLQSAPRKSPKFQSSQKNLYQQLSHLVEGSLWRWTVSDTRSRGISSGQVLIPLLLSTSSSKDWASCYGNLYPVLCWHTDKRASIAASGAKGSGYYLDQPPKRLQVLQKKGLLLKSKPIVPGLKVNGGVSKKSKAGERLAA